MQPQCNPNGTLCSPCATLCSHIQLNPMPLLLFREDVLSAVKAQRRIFEETTVTRRKALESQKFLALLFYTALPPGRTKEFQTLHVAFHETLPRPVVDQEMPNCLHITTDGSEAFMLLGDYKTHKAYGDHFLPLEKDSQLLRHLAVHLNEHRKCLVVSEESTFLFLVSILSPYTVQVAIQHIHATFVSIACVYE